MKAVTYLYDTHNPDACSIYQDLTSQIRVFSFRQSQIPQVKRQNHVEKAGIYFLISEDEDIKQIYIGQSINGISRIQNHLSTKSFWQKCLLFVTDNASFSKTAIDYLEFYFINYFNNSDYVIENKERRKNEPVLNDFEQPALLESARQIEFLLACQGIKSDQQIQQQQQKGNIFPAAGKFNAHLLIEDGKFILLKGSEILKPKETLKQRSQSNSYQIRDKAFSDLLQSNKIKLIDETRASTLVNLSFTSPSAPACLVRADSANGWAFWKGLDKVRDQFDIRTLESTD